MEAVIGNTYQDEIARLQRHLLQMNFVFVDDGDSCTIRMQY